MSCDAGNAPPPTVVLSGHRVVAPIAVAGDYLVFGEIVDGENTTNPVLLLAKVRTDGTGYQIVFDPRKEGTDVSAFLADERDIYVRGKPPRGLLFPITRIPTQGGSAQEIAKRNLRLLALDSEFLYVEEDVLPIRITGISRTGGPEQGMASLMLGDKALNAYDTQLRGKELWFSDGNAKNLYSVELSSSMPTPVPRGKACGGFSLMPSGILCTDPAGLALIDTQTGQQTVALDVPKLDARWWEYHRSGLKLFPSEPDGSTSYVFGSAVGMPVWRFDVAQLKATPLACNRTSVEGLGVGKSDVFWIENFRRAADERYFCLFRAPKS
jgi:hypothetical protein